MTPLDRYKKLVRIRDAKVILGKRLDYTIEKTLPPQKTHISLNTNNSYESRVTIIHNN